MKVRLFRNALIWEEVTVWPFCQKALITLIGSHIQDETDQSLNGLITLASGQSDPIKTNILISSLVTGSDLFKCDNAALEIHSN